MNTNNPLSIASLAAQFARMLVQMFVKEEVFLNTPKDKDIASIAECFSLEKDFLTINGEKIEHNSLVISWEKMSFTLSELYGSAKKKGTIRPKKLIDIKIDVLYAICVKLDWLVKIEFADGATMIFHDGTTPTLPDVMKYRIIKKIDPLEARFRLKNELGGHFDPNLEQPVRLHDLTLAVNRVFSNVPPRTGTQIIADYAKGITKNSPWGKVNSSDTYGCTVDTDWAIEVLDAAKLGFFTVAMEPSVKSGDDSCWIDYDFPRHF